MTRNDNNVAWPDNRYRLFSLILSAVSAIIAANVISALSLFSFKLSAGALFTFMYALMDPKSPLRIKHRVAELLLGDGAFASNHAIIWQNWDITINIGNCEGDTSVTRKVKLKNRDTDPLKAHTHYFSFFNGQRDDPKIVNTEEGPITAKDNKSRLSTETIVKSHKEYKFFTNYSTPVKTGETYEYEIEANNVRRAFPVEDGRKETWIADFAAPVEQMSIAVNYNDNVTFTSVDFRDKQTQNSLGDIDIRNAGNMIKLEAGKADERIRPGVYELVWTLNYDHGPES